MNLDGLIQTFHYLNFKGLLLRFSINSPVILSLYLKIIATEGFSQQNVLLGSLE